MISFNELGKMGRLGNQLFQLAATIALATRNNDKYMLPPWQYEKYFNLHGCFSNNIRATTTYNEPFFHYKEILHRNTSAQILELKGYFQSEKYFIDCAELIRQAFTPIYGIHLQPETTSIHVRRGDYLKLSHAHTNLSPEYYAEAVKITNTKNYIVFSDDIEWCKNNFAWLAAMDKNIIFSTNKSPVEDLTIMAGCQNNIIANSSFSWWSGWLNPNTNKTIVAPKNWFGPTLQHNVKDLCPEAWKKI